MVWFTERALRRACAAALAALCCGAAGAAEDESDRWFNRHAEALWRPLVEKWPESKAAMTSPVENLMLPLGYYENGRIKAVLRAQKSQMYADGLIYAEGVRVEMLTVDGKPDGQLQADGCLFDRKSKRGYCEGVVHMVKGTDRLKGRGMYFSIDEQFIKILSECEIRTNRIPVKLGRIS
jgi:lipopolysaccharide assembly outer membrane protein LptD (OstA)